MKIVQRNNKILSNSQGDLLQKKWRETFSSSLSHSRKEDGEQITPKCRRRERKRKKDKNESLCSDAPKGLFFLFLSLSLLSSIPTPLGILINLSSCLVLRKCTTHTYSHNTTALLSVQLEQS